MAERQPKSQRDEALGQSSSLALGAGCKIETTAGAHRLAGAAIQDTRQRCWRSATYQSRRQKLLQINRSFPVLKHVYAPGAILHRQHAGSRPLQPCQAGPVLLPPRAQDHGHARVSARGVDAREHKGGGNPYDGALHEPQVAAVHLAVKALLMPASRGASACELM